MMITGLLVLLLYELVGEVLVLLLKLPTPGPVVGMLLLLVTLMLLGKIPTELDKTATTLSSVCSAARAMNSILDPLPRLLAKLLLWRQLAGFGTQAAIALMLIELELKRFHLFTLSRK